MARSASELSAALDQAQSRYRGHFAGQPRFSRDLSLLDQILADGEAVASEAGSTAPEIAERAQALLGTWREERAKIAEVQSDAQRMVDQSIEQWARDSFARYERNFAGRSRSSRDIGLLLECVADLEVRKAELEAQKAGRDVAELDTLYDAVSKNLEVYRGELGAIREARASGTADERAMRLANLANQQFARYRLLFAGKDRKGRRRQVLETIVSVLEELLAEMQAIAGDTGFERHADNVGIVQSNLDLYRREIQLIRAAHNNASRNARVSELANAANEVFQGYRKDFVGQRRDTRDENLLNGLWEQLWPVALEMEAMARLDDSDPVGVNLRKVRDNLRLYEREWGLIRQAKSSAEAS